MILSKTYKNTLLILAACLVLTACATKKEVATDSIKGQMQSDVYTGTESVEYLADGVPDRVFFATNETILTTASIETLRAQAACFLKVSLDAVVKTVSFVAKKTLSGTPEAKYSTVSFPV